MGVLGISIPKTIDVSYGQFICSQCQRNTPYKHKERVQRRFVFFFVPILGDTIAEYIECQVCRSRFPLDVLRSGLSPDIVQILEAIKDKLKSGISTEEAEATLIRAGIDAGTVQRYVTVAAGIGLKRCPRCSLTFRGDVPKCHKCGHVFDATNI